jgi:hypothetical protein
MGLTVTFGGTPFIMSSMLGLAATAQTKKTLVTSVRDRDIFGADLKPHQNKESGSNSRSDSYL